MPTRILFASNNPSKLVEAREILQPEGFEVVAPADLGLSLEVPETGASFAENAKLKAEAFARASDMIAVADDSGLVVDALGGEPGIRSARYGGPAATDHDRIQLVLEKLRGVPEQRRTASFVAAIAVAAPTQETRIFEATVDGLICSPRGEGGFGYDPIFYYPPLRQTFAALDRREKSGVSHRGRGLRLAADYLRIHHGAAPSRGENSARYTNSEPPQQGST